MLITDDEFAQLISEVGQVHCVTIKRNGGAFIYEAQYGQAEVMSALGTPPARGDLLRQITRVQWDALINAGARIELRYLVTELVVTVEATAAGATWRVLSNNGSAQTRELAAKAGRAAAFDHARHEGVFTEADRKRVADLIVVEHA